MENSEQMVEKELDDAETLMQPVFVPGISGSEGTLEDSIMEENLKRDENAENVEIREFTLKRELDDADAFISPLCVPIESEPEFHGITEDPIMHVEFEATQNTEARDVVSAELKVKKNITDAETSLGPTKAESDVGKTSDENVKEDSQAGKTTMVLVSQASFLVKEEPIDYEETWQDSIKLEPICPLSMDSQNDGSDTRSEDGVNVKVDDIVEEELEELTSLCSLKEEKRDISEGNSVQPHLNYSPLPGSSQFVSSTESLSGMEGTDSQKNIGRCSISYSRKTVRLPIFGCQSVLSPASSSKDIHTVGQEKAAGTYLWEKQVEKQVVGERENQQSGHLEDRISTNLEESHSEGDMLQLDPLGSSTGEGFFKCDHCGKDLRTKCDLVRHMRTHTGYRPYKCSRCGKSFTQNRKLTSHMRTHSSDRPYKCSQCGKSFTKVGSLTRHMRIHRGYRPYKCPQCGASFTRSSHLTVHVRKHTGDRPYKCPQCRASFTGSSHLTVHVRKHTGDRPYKCSHCEKSFAQRGNLSRHMRTHSGDRPYKCSQCKKSFRFSGNLSRHLRTHTGDQPYKCSHCEKSFTESGSLSSHMRTHSGDRPYKCSQCRKSFTFSGNLSRHMRTHTGDRPYKCSHCGKSFTESSHLTSHIRTHSGDRPYKCSQCLKSFTQSGILSRRLRTHTSDWPHKCSQCGASFTESSSLTVHMRKHTGNRPY